MDEFESEVERLNVKYVDRPVTKRLIYETRVDMVAIDNNLSLTEDQKQLLKITINQFINRNQNGTQV